MRLDRRVPLFLTISAIAYLLTFVADENYDHVPPIVGTAYLVLAALFFLDWRSRRSR